MAQATAGYVRDWQTLFDAGTAVGLTDGELLRRYAEGRDGSSHGAEAAFGALIQRHGGMVLRVCRAVLADRHAAEDAFQATFLVLARRSRSLRAAETIGPWLHQVALRTARSARSAALRRRRHEQASAPDRPRMIQACRDEPARDDDARAVHEEIGRLPIRYRRVVVLCYLEGLTHPEAAARLKRPVGTVRSRLSRGRDLLRRRLERRGLAPSIVAMGAAPPRVPLGLREATLALVGKSSLPALAGRLSFGLWTCALGALVATAAVLPSGRPTGFAAQVAPAPGKARPIEPAPKPPGKLVKVHGVVSDLAGKPVAGVTVVVALGNWRTVFVPGPVKDGFEMRMVGKALIVTTGGDGRYAAEGRIAPEEVHIVSSYGQAIPYANIVAYKPGLAPTASLDQCDSGDVAVDLTLGEPEPYVGVVRDDKNQPVLGATITVAKMIGPVVRAESRRFLYPSESTVRGTPLEGLFIVKSDEAGRFRFPAVPKPGMLTVQADALGKKASVRYDAYPIPGTEQAPAVIGPLQPEARIEGRLTTALPGVSVANRKVRIKSVGNDIHEVVATDDQGRFGLGCMGWGTVSVLLESTCPRPEDPWTYRPAYIVGIPPGGTARPIVEIVRGGCLEGRVVDADSGAPVPGFTIVLYPIEKKQLAIGFFVVHTDADGGCSARLAPGSWFVHRWDGKPAFDRPVEVVEEKTIVLDAIKMSSKAGP